jgi:hypothetical protein
MGIGLGLGAGIISKFCKNAAYMVFHGSFADEQARCDLAIGMPLR